MMMVSLWKASVAWRIMAIMPLSVTVAFLLVPASPLSPPAVGVGLWPVQNHLLTLDPRPKLILKGKHGGRRVLELRAVPLPGSGYLHVDLNGVLPQLISRSVGPNRDSHTGSEDDEDDKRREESPGRSVSSRNRATSEDGARGEGRLDKQETEAADERAKPSFPSVGTKGLPQLLCLPLSSPLLQSATRQLSRIRPYSVTRYMERSEQDGVICYRQSDLRAVGCIL